MADIHGKLVSVSVQTAGGNAVSTAAIGARTLSLDDVSDFDEDGGYVSVGLTGTVYAYDTVDMDLDTIHLTTALTASVAVDDVIALWDNDQSTPVTERVALVTIDGQGDGDPLPADIDHSLSALLDRTTWAVGQSVTVAEDGDGYRLTGVHGKDNRAIHRSRTDGVRWGIDPGDGTIVGIFSDGNALVRLQTLGDVRIKMANSTAFAPILASAFTVSSDPDVKTGETEAPDALEIIAAAPAKGWRYKTDDDDVKRIGPMADNLPDWIAQVDPQDGTLMVDTVRLIGVLWAAVGQLQTRLDDLEAT